MTTRERDAISVLTDHVMELKQDMGEVKADLRALKEAQGATGEARRWGRTHGLSLLAICTSVGVAVYGFIR